MSSIIYLDHCATTPCDPAITAAMMKYFESEYGNPSSLHLMGKRAKHAVNQSIAQIAKLIGASPDEIVLTSGATESNNLAILGAFDYSDSAPANALFCPTDHKSSLDAAKELARRGIGVSMMQVKRSGLSDLETIKRALNEHTRIVSLCLVNSELGCIQPIEEIARICSDYDVILHVDAVQSAGKLPIHVKEMGIDALSLSAHKLYGPKGIGALYVSADASKKLRPLLFGGGQNRLRSGTLPTPLIVGFGMACEAAHSNLQHNYETVHKLRAAFLHELSEQGVDYAMNTDMETSVPHTLNIQFPGVSSEALVIGLRDVAISAGSACNSDSLEPSYILTGIGLSNEEANQSVRICLSPRLTAEEVRTAAARISAKAISIQCVNALM